MPCIAFRGLIGSQAEQPDIVVHCRCLSLNKERPAEEVNKNAAFFQEFDQLLSTAVNFIRDRFQKCVISRID